MARRLKSLLPGSAVDGHGGGLGSLAPVSARQGDDQSVKQDLPEDTADGAADQGRQIDSAIASVNSRASLGFSRNLGNGHGSPGNGTAASNDAANDGTASDGTVNDGTVNDGTAVNGSTAGSTAGSAAGDGAQGDGAQGDGAQENGAKTAGANGPGSSGAGGGRTGRGGSHAAPRGSGHGAGRGAGHETGDAPEAAPTATLDRPVKERRRRWLTGQLRDVPAANPLCDLSLLVRVRDRLKELPDQDPANAQLATGSTGDPSPAESDPDQAIRAIRDTFAIVGAAGDMAAAYFYGWLFAHHPDLRELFPPAMDEQRDRLFSALTHIVESLRTPEEMGVYLAQLGRDHRKYAVKPEMYGAVGTALIATLRAFAGSAFTPAAEEAWVSTYGVASDIMIKAAEEMGSDTPAFWHAEVVDHERRGHEVAVVTIAPEERFNYRAGQHVTVQTSRWPRVWRPYSIACRQREDGLLRFHVKAVSGGWVSNTLVSRTSVGDPLILGPAVGNMTLAPAERRDLVCVAGGTGLSPIKAIVEQVVFEEATQRNHRNIWLFWGARTEKDMYDLRDLWRLTDIYPWLQVHPVTSDDPAYPGMQGNVGRVAARYLPHADCEAYVSGPAAMVQETIRMMTKVGMPIERVHYDDGLIAGRKRVGSGT